MGARMETTREAPASGPDCASATVPASTNLAPVPLGSVVIPAHNEERVIGRCLSALTDTVAPGELELIVVCNGCTDRTADVARRHAPTATVVELEEPSKTSAIREGERHATAVPRLYLDADVMLPGSTAQALLSVLSAGAVAARPPMQYDTSSSSALVRSYYRARTELPSLGRHAWGAGVYGLSAEGRARFGEFPDVMADDFWIDGMLEPGELVVVDAAPGKIKVPTTAGTLLRILRRAQRGKRECVAAGTPAPETESAVAKDLVLMVKRRPKAVGDALVYVAFALAARVRTRRTATLWERDESSRLA
jgi:glycosyltransferase involved in cell wall biosynthesis